MTSNARRRNSAIAIFIAGTLFQLLLQRAAEPYAIDGHRFQEWSSERLMQTVSIQDLRDEPLETIANIHIQPPGLDIVRAMLVHLRGDADINSALRKVDQSLYLIWAVVYGLGGMIVFLWVERLTGSLAFAVVAALLFLLHPAVIFYATLLDTTLLSAVLVLWMYYALWRIANGHASIAAFTIAVVLLFFFRSVFQLPAILVFGASLYLLRVPRRSLVLFLAIAGGIYGLYTAKQYAQFGLTGTSSFTGINLVRSADIRKDEYPYPIDLEPEPSRPLPQVLTRKTKIDGSRNYNNFHYLDFNARLREDFEAYLSTFPVRGLVASYAQNVQYYFRPSSRYSDHVIVDRLPWRSVFDGIFSGPILILLLSAAAAVALARVLRERRYARAVALLLPAAYIFFVSVVFEKGENARFKFFLEPVLYVFIVSQLYRPGMDRKYEHLRSMIGKSR